MRYYHLACVRGVDTFGLTIQADSIKAALSRAKKMLVDSGYTAYPLRNK